MRRATPLAFALLLAVSVSPAGPTRAASDPRQPTEAATRPAPAPSAGGARTLSAAGRYIVVLRASRSVDVATGRATRLGVRADRTFRNVIRGYSARLSPDQLAQLRTDPDVEAVVPDEVISIQSQAIPTGIRRVGGRESTIAHIDGTDDRVDADVAIVDTGIGSATARTHQDLNIAGGYSCSTTSHSAWGDPNGHGTHVAGTVGALDNGIGVVGVAPGVRLWSVRILDSAGNGLVSWYVCGLDWITAQRDPTDPTRPMFEAVNMSVARKGTDDNNCGLTNKDPMHQAICRLVASGVTVVAAAGNNKFNASNLKPASYNEVITVSALADTDGKPGATGGNLCTSWGSYDKDDTFADFSNYGGDVDLIAPGKCIWSTLPGNRYGYISGTSMATPHVTGAAALYKATRPLATPAQVRAALRAAGTLDWRTSTDPDSVHEPLLDVSHIVAAGDFTVDLTPGTVHSATVGAAGGAVSVPVQLYRAEDFPGDVDLTVTADPPLAAGLQATTLSGQAAVATTVDVTVPEATPSGTYRVIVRATDGSRTRASSFPIVVDGVAPVVGAPGIGLRTSGNLATGVGATGSWAAGSDAVGTISGYEIRWRVDGALEAAISLSAASRSTTHALLPGHAYVLRLRAVDAAGNWSGLRESASVVPTLSEDTSGSLRRSAGWIRTHSSRMSGGTALSSARRGAWVSRSFTGRSIALIGSTGPNRGKIKVYISGFAPVVVDLRRTARTDRRVLLARSWSTSAARTMKVVVLGTSGRPRIDVDAFVIVR